MAELPIAFGSNNIYNMVVNVVYFFAIHIIVNNLVM